MTDPLERLARLSAHGTSLERMAASTGGRVTASDIAAALAAVRDPKARLFGHYLGGQDVYDELEREMLMEVVDLATREQWRLHQAGILRGLVRLAVLESIAGKVCRTCNGQGKVPTETGRQVCSRCMGLRYAGWTAQERAEITGIQRSDWSRRWAQRYRQVAAIVDGYTDQLRRALRTQLRG